MSTQRAWCSSAENLCECSTDSALATCFGFAALLIAGACRALGQFVLYRGLVLEDERMGGGKWKGKRGPARVFQSSTCFVPIASEAANACCYRVVEREF
jgi:hypothetical protein